MTAKAKVSVADEIAAFAGENRRERCSIAVALAALDDDRRTEVETLLRHGDLPAATIGRWLTKTTGVKVAGDAPARHRRGACSCP